MLLSLIGYLFCVVLGLWGFYITGVQVVQGTLTSTLDNLFLTMFAALMGVTCFGFLAWRFYPALTAGGTAAAAGTVDEASQPYVLPADPDYVDSHMPLFNKIWLGLLAFTALEVVLAYVQIAGALVMLAILLVLSLVKAAMIMSAFMHLQFDHPRLTWVVVAPAVACILIMCGYFFSDSFWLVALRP